MRQASPWQGATEKANESGLYSTTQLETFKFCTGKGKFATDKKPDGTYQENLPGITWKEIQQLVDAPQERDKSIAQWLIPSDQQTRLHKTHEEKGRFGLLWADIDKWNINLDQLRNVIDLLNCDFEIYSTKSATPENKKWRVLIPLLKPLCGVDYHVAAGLLNDHLYKRGIHPDRTTEGSGQLCFLPNLGKHYETASNRDGAFFDPLAYWHDEIEERRKAESDIQEERANERARRASRPPKSFDSTATTSPIDAFNSAYAVEEILERNNYSRKPGSRTQYRHPNSQSGSYSANVKDGRVHSLSTNDPLFADGAGAHDAFSAFCILEHSGDQKAAVRAAAEEFGLNDDDPVGVCTDESLFADYDENESKETRGQADPFTDPLPGALGMLQEFVYGAMIYPDTGVAGLTALAIMSHYAQKKAIVNTLYGQLALNEYYIVMAKTTFGKESLLKAIEFLDDKLHTGYCSTSGERPGKFGSVIHHSLPASQQGLHKLLEDSSAATFLSDEFAEWLVQASTLGNSHRQACVGHLMESYGRGMGILSAPVSIANRYQPVKHPRVTIFATTTGERLAESLTLSQAESGTYNRMVLYVGPQERITKRYEGFELNISKPLLSWFDWLHALRPDTEVGMEYGAIDYFKSFDSSVVEAIKFNDPLLGGRLSEQALKLAGLIALSNRKAVISKADLELAYRIRMNIYESAKSFLNGNGSLTGEDETVQAFNQVREVLQRKGRVALGRLPDYSRAYKKLPQFQREKTADSLIKHGLAKMEKGLKHGRVLVYTGNS